MPGNAIDTVRTAARDVGFAAAGIAAVGPLERMDRYDAWLASGCAAGMDYLCRHRDVRADPRRILPNYRSVDGSTSRHLGGNPENKILLKKSDGPS